MERLIDSYSEGVIEKEQFVTRLSRTKERIEEVESRIRSGTESAVHRQELRILVDYFQKLACHLCADLENADWNLRREIIRSLLDRNEIGRANVVVVFRIPDGVALSSKNPVFVTFSRC